MTYGKDSLRSIFAKRRTWQKKKRISNKDEEPYLARKRRP